ncbi:MAG: patatin family protein [Tissierellia bacterium]|nr:patatin family protein [Tissierellia bacterium]
MYCRNISLLLEGGGARCAFTAGVLDYFLEKELTFPIVIGVSAGSLTGINFISKQYKRFLSMVLDRSNIRFNNSSIKTNELYDMYRLIVDLNDNLSEFDFESFQESNSIFLASAIKATTGETVYFEANSAGNINELLKIISASCALPAFAKPVTINHENYFDGGFTEAIPLFESLKRKYDKTVVVLTRPRDYRKEREKVSNDGKRKLERYPEIIECIENRHIRYNDTLTFLDHMERTGDAVIISPSSDLNLNALELNYSKTLSMYRDGYQSAKKTYIDICNLSDGRKKNG